MYEVFVFYSIILFIEIIGIICGPAVIEAIPDITLEDIHYFNKTISVNKHFDSPDSTMVFLSLVNPPSWLTYNLLPAEYVGHYFGSEGDTAIRIVSDGKFTYSSHASKGVTICDISDKANPQLVFNDDSGGGGKDVFLYNDLLLSSHGIGGVQVYNITDRSNPSLLHTIIPNGEAVGAFVENDLVFVADQPNKYVIYNISDPTDISFIGELDYTSSKFLVSECLFDVGPHRNSTFCYVGSGDDSIGGLYVINATERENPSFVYRETASMGHTRDIIIDNNFQYQDSQFRMLFAMDSSGLRIFNISQENYDHPVRLYDHGLNKGRAVGYSYPYIFIGDEDDGVIMLHLPSIPDEFQVIDSVGVYGMHIFKNYIYIADYDSGITWFSFGNINLTFAPNEDEIFCGNTTVTIEAKSSSEYFSNNSTFVNFTVFFEDKCSKYATCNSRTNQCICKNGNYTGQMCEKWKCHGLWNYDDQVCGENGRCIDFNYCDCNESHFGVNCSVFQCFGVYGDNKLEVCSGHGDCVQEHVCQCEPNYYGVSCNISTCNGMFSNDSMNYPICNSRGICIDYNNCSCYQEIRSPQAPFCLCQPYYFGYFCNVTTCDGIFSNETDQVCQGHGICDINSKICNCTSDDYTGDYCENWNCDGEERTNLNSVCNGHGECIDVDNCTCDDSGEYGGEFCGEWRCFNISRLSVNLVCGGHGTCVEPNKCVCQDGYFPDGVCIDWFCSNVKKSSDEVCSGFGSCETSHTCICDRGYEGDDCETFSCGNIDKDDRSVCSGSGECVAPSNCECNKGFSGDNCQTNIYLLTIAVPILSAAGGIFLLIIASLGLLFCCCICIVLAFSCCFSCILMIYLLSQRLKWKKFGKLKNFDILLTEQELDLADESENLAKLSIKTELFHIDMDEIKLTLLLGEGGSNSTVFQGLWQGKDIAFKCFRTRHILSNQDTFEEFEKEVEVMASLSHPNVIRFFGACLKPPRVGILMEFCGNGDLKQFICRFSFDNDGERYEFEGKYRILGEIIAAMKYLHSRKIIHRDLKLENVLLDDEETSKLMDFGLSRHVERMSMKKTTRVGTDVYMPPELTASTGLYNEKCDSYSFAILIWIFLTENLDPYQGVQNVELIVANNPKYRPDLGLLKGWLPKGYLWIAEVVKSCWDHDSENRYSFKKLSNIFREKSKYYDDDDEKESYSSSNSSSSSSNVENSASDDEDEDDDDGVQNDGDDDDDDDDDDENVITTTKNEKEFLLKLLLKEKKKEGEVDDNDRDLMIRDLISKLK